MIGMIGMCCMCLCRGNYANKNEQFGPGYVFRPGGGRRRTPNLPGTTAWCSEGRRAPQPLPFGVQLAEVKATTESVQNNAGMLYYTIPAGLQHERRHARKSTAVFRGIIMRMFQEKITLKPMPHTIRWPSQHHIYIYGMH